MFRYVCHQLKMWSHFHFEFLVEEPFRSFSLSKQWRYYIYHFINDFYLSYNVERVHTLNYVSLLKFFNICKFTCAVEKKSYSILVSCCVLHSTWDGIYMSSNLFLSTSFITYWKKYVKLSHILCLFSLFLIHTAWHKLLDSQLPG